MNPIASGVDFAKIQTCVTKSTNSLLDKEIDFKREKYAYPRKHDARMFF